MIKPVIKRYLSCEVFKQFKEDLKQLFIKIRKDKKLSIDGDFWDMQFRKDDTITLYYKGT